MLSADGFQDGIGHGLRVNADAVNAVPPQDQELFPRDGVGAPGLHGPLPESGEIRFPLQMQKQLIQLPGGERRGGAAAHVDRHHPQSGVSHLFRHGGKLQPQRRQKGRNLRGAASRGLADEAAVGAAGGAEGDADIKAHVLRVQGGVCLQRHP